ncbi:helix-turn-helix domain-containing protein [Paenibacillus sp. FSL K6-0276]|uniref:GH39 family glycosyl hydrolase n=1 Tax=Paenibacillus sp. FSL K6-0276 TaxID=2921450 RepID=UPI0030EECC9C
MKTTYEVITTNRYIPFRLLLHRPNHVQMHWHENLEIIFVLKGTIELFRQQERHLLHESAITVINSKEVHSISGDENSLILALQVSHSYIEEQFAGIKELQFHCDSYLYDHQHQTEFDPIRQILAYMMLTYTKQAPGYELELKGLLFRLMAYLVRYYSNPLQGKEASPDVKFMDRLLAITEFIQHNYAKPISLTEIAEQEFLSVHYLSRFFQKYLGTTFSQYLNGVRLEYALVELTYSDLTITQVALNNGFPSIKAFNKVFKDFYGSTPREYRMKQADDMAVHAKAGASKTPNYLEMNQQDAFKELFKYLPSESQKSDFIMQDKMIVKTESIDLDANTATPLMHTWRRLTSIGKAKEGLFGEVQRQLTQLQKDIGFSYIRFHGIFDDEMMVYHENGRGEPYYLFTYVDQLFDFFLSIGLKPFIELGFMPSKLASGDATIFVKKSNVSYPNQLTRWMGLVEALIDHCIERYGVEEMTTWYVEVWNEPDVVSFWSGTQEQYFTFYQATHEVIRKYPKMRIGGPSLLSPTILNDTWLQDFLYFCMQNHCVPDFISFHSYPFDQIFYDAMQLDGGISEEFVWTAEEMSKYWTLSAAEDYLSQVIAKARDIVVESGANIKEIHLTEWNSSGNQRDLIHDTCYQSAYIVKNVIDTIDQVDSLCYWTCTDFLEEFLVPNQVFHGGLGLMTNNGIEKAAYHAYQILAKLGSEMIQRGENYCITRQGNEIQVLLFHYVHTDALYRRNDVSHLNEYDRYRIFKHNDPLELTLELSCLAPGSYQIRKTSLNRQWGSSFDRWVDMGHPKHLHSEDIAYLRSTSQPKREIFVQLIDQQFNLKAELSPHEVQLYEMKRI